MFSLIKCVGTWPGLSIITWTSWSQAIVVSSPGVSSSANWTSSFASVLEPGAEIVAQRGDVVRRHDLADPAKRV